MRVLACVAVGACHAAWKQMGFDARTVIWITVVAHLADIAGRLLFGQSPEHIGRVKDIKVASLLVLPALPIWTNRYSAVLLAAGTFFVQAGMQGG